MSKPKNQRRIEVYADWEGLENPMLMGVLYTELLRGKEIFSFEYDQAWLHSGYADSLDPELKLYTGPQYLADEKPNFGLFMDSSPDRWGRVLMRRREAEMARREKRGPRTLFESDYLLGVYDKHRMGALRFKSETNGPFLNDNTEMSAPPWTSIRELSQVSLRLEEDDAMNDPDYLKWLTMLIAPGASLGGHRPKASVTDPEGNLWIAKFPSKTDDTDIGAWEMVTYQMAINAGLQMAECRVKKYAGKYHTFLTKRFDRTAAGTRIHFASAMTMLNYTDGTGHKEGVSYLELADFLNTQGAQPAKDLEELWKRIVFGICVSNTDDHLRNHGFLLTGSGWILSPAYDINPVETGTGLSLNISEHDNALNLDLAMEVYPFFRLKEKRAIQLIYEIKNQVQQWQKFAEGLGIPRSDQELKAPAFISNEKFQKIFNPENYAGYNPENDIPKKITAQIIHALQWDKKTGIALYKPDTSNYKKVFHHIDELVSFINEKIIQEMHDHMPMSWLQDRDFVDYDTYVREYLWHHHANDMDAIGWDSDEI